MASVRPLRKITTIKIEKDTKLRLDRLKETEHETYNEILKKILYILNTTRKNPDVGNRLLRSLDASIKRKLRYGSNPNKSSKKYSLSENSKKKSGPR